MRKIGCSADCRDRIWDEGKDIETGEPLKSCTMIITEANDFVSKVHDRMPVLFFFLAEDRETGMIVDDGFLSARTEMLQSPTGGMDLIIYHI
jgi:putative SOS response-associated peptidase YedK